MVSFRVKLIIMEETNIALPQKNMMVSLTVEREDPIRIEINSNMTISQFRLFLQVCYM